MIQYRPNVRDKSLDVFRMYGRFCAAIRERNRKEIQAAGLFPEFAKRCIRMQFAALGGGDRLNFRRFRCVIPCYGKVGVFYRIQLGGNGRLEGISNAVFIEEDAYIKMHGFDSCPPTGNGVPEQGSASAVSCRGENRLGNVIPDKVA